MLLILYLQIFIPLIFIGFFSFKSSEEIITKKSLAYSNDILSLIELRLQDTVRSANNIAEDLSNDERLYNALMSDDNKSILYNYEIRNQLNNVFQSIIMTKPEIESMCIVTNKRRFFNYDNNSTESNIKSVVQQNYTEIRKKALAANYKIAWFFDSKNKVVQNAYLIKMIYSKDNWTELGLLIVQINRDFLNPALQGLETEVMQNTMVMSSSGDIILSKNIDDFTKFREVLTNIPFGSNKFTEKKVSSFTDNESKLFIAYTAITEPDWRIVTYIPVKKLYSDVDDLRNRIVILCLCTVILLSITSIFLSFDFIKPINRLVKAMEEMSIDNIQNSYIEVDRNDELGFLHKTFNKMAKEIDHLVTWIYREQLTRKEAEIKALQSQINPHFLFNTLESINWMARLNDVPEISDTVSDLSTLLEASIGRDDKLITVEEEFMYIDKYIAILKRRFEDRITLNKEVDPKVLYSTLPRLLIQPLIENAVYHGVENNRNKGIINLSAKLCEDDNTILIEIYDNGSGIPGDELIRLNKGLEMNNEAYFKSYENKKNKSIGIENVNRRIKLFYGEKYGVKIESKVNIYTKVTVTFPIRNYNSKDGYYVQSANN